MKNSLLLLMLFSLFIVSCTPKIAYTEEFPYLPSYKNMVVQVDEDNSNNEQYETTDESNTDELKKFTYIVGDANIDTALNEYEKILIQDGWKITLDNKPNLIEIQKDEHIASIVAYQKNNNVMFDISSK